MLAILFQTIAMLLYGAVVVGTIALVVICLAGFFRHIGRINRLTNQERLAKVISGEKR